MTTNAIRETKPLRIDFLSMVQYTISNTVAVGLDASVPDGASGFYYTLRAHPVAWRADGTDPTSAVGIEIATGSPLEPFVRNNPRLVNAIRFISIGADSAIMNVHFFQEP